MNSKGKNNEIEVEYENEEVEKERMNEMGWVNGKEVDCEKKED